MEVKLGVFIGKIEHVITRVIPQVCEVVMSTDLNDNSIVEVTDDLEVARCKVGVPQLLGFVACASVGVATYDKLAATASCG